MRGDVNAALWHGAPPFYIRLRQRRKIFSFLFPFSHFLYCEDIQYHSYLFYMNKNDYLHDVKCITEISILQRLLDSCFSPDISCGYVYLFCDFRYISPKFFPVFVQEWVGTIMNSRTFIWLYIFLWCWLLLHLSSLCWFLLRLFFLCWFLLHYLYYVDFYYIYLYYVDFYYLYSFSVDLYYNYSYDFYCILTMLIFITFIFILVIHLHLVEGWTLHILLTTLKAPLLTSNRPRLQLLASHVTKYRGKYNNLEIYSTYYRRANICTIFFYIYDLRKLWILLKVFFSCCFVLTIKVSEGIFHELCASRMISFVRLDIAFKNYLEN